MDCTSIINSLDVCEGAPQLSGIRKRAWIANVADIVKFATLPKDENRRVTDSVLVGDFVLKADKKWKYIEFNPDTSQANSDPEGEAPSQLQVNKLSLVHPGVDERATAMAAAFNNSNVIVIWQDMTGHYRVCGANLYRNKMTVTQDNGQGPTGTPQTTFAMEARDYIPHPFYKGTLETEDGTLDCSTDAIDEKP